MQTQEPQPQNQNQPQNQEPQQNPKEETPITSSYPPDFISQEESIPSDIEETEIIESILKKDYNLFESENE